MTTARRIKGDGSVYQRSDGRWAGVSSAITDGHRTRRFVYGSTRAEAARKLRELDRAAVEPQSTAPATTSRTFGEFTEEWLAEILPRQVRPSTVDNYTHVLRQHVLPLLRNRPLHDIKAREVESVTAAVTASGRSPRTAALTHTLIRRVLSEAERREEITRNVGRVAVAPRVPRREARTLRPEEARRVVAAALEAGTMGALVVLLLGTGLRLGEALALQWGDVDLVSGSVRVRRTLSRRTGEGVVLSEPKTATSRRLVAMPAVVAVALQPLPRGTYVFESECNSPLDSANVRRWLRRFMKAQGLGEWTPHELRHSAASLLLSEGVPLKVVSDVLGHSSIQITADVYSHVLPELRRDAAAALDRTLT